MTTEAQTLSDRMILDGLRLSIEVWADDEDQCYYATCDEFPPGIRGKGKMIQAAVSKLIKDQEYFEIEGLS